MAGLALLRTFLAVYRAGTFTQAASDLHLTQPAVSVQIRSLESQLGRRLFTRSARGVEPTAAGMELAQAVSAQLDSLEETLGARETSSSALDSVYLGGPAEFITVRVVPVLSPLVADGLRLRMYFDVDAPIVERLLAGELDLAVTTSEWSRRGLDTERLCYEYLVLVASPAWAKDFGEISAGKRGAHALRDVPLIAYDEELPLVADYWQTVFKTPVAAGAGAIANSLRAALSLAVDGAGVTVLPQHACAQALRRGELVQLLSPAQPPRNQLYLSWRSGSLRRPSLARVHARISESARDW